MTAELPLRHALALGLVHGPAELLPISSSAHITLIPWLAGWPYEQLEPPLRKSFEVALHAGAALGLLMRLPSEHLLGEPSPASDGPPSVGAARSPARSFARRLAFLAAASAPAAALGYALHGPIERRLGTPGTISAGLIGGSFGMAWAEARARRDAAQRSAAQAGLADGLALGVAQALALIPGVSRSGAAFAVARARGFAPVDAERLSLAVGLPVLGGATLLQSAKLLRRGEPHCMRPALAVGACAAFASTLLTPALLDAGRRSRAVLPAAVYRLLLAGTVLKRNLTATADDKGILEAFEAPS